jgi:hypothetical protein
MKRPNYRKAGTFQMGKTTQLPELVISQSGKTKSKERAFGKITSLGVSSLGTSMKCQSDIGKMK